MNFKVKITISTIGVILIISLITVFIIIPTISDIKKISNPIYLERVDLEKKYLRGQLLKKTVSNFEEIKSQKNKLDTIFIKEGEELKFISTLEGIASLNSVDQTIELRVKDVEEKRGTKTFPLKITAKGSFAQVMNYLTDLEGLDYYLNISSVDLIGEKGSIIATFSGEVFGRAENGET